MVVTPRARPSTIRTSLTVASVRISAPFSVAAPAIDWEMAPWPPRTKPQPPAPAFSPMTWCMITYALPGVFGPAKVPIEA